MLGIQPLCPRAQFCFHLDLHWQTAGLAMKRSLLTEVRGTVPESMLFTLRAMQTG